MCDSTEAIDNLYEKLGLTYCKDCRKFGSVECYYLCESNHAPFTAEKQLELIKRISKKRTFKRVHVKLGYKYILRLVNVEDGEPYQGLSNDSFEEALANLVLDLLRDVKRYEKNKIKEILR